MDRIKRGKNFRGVIFFMPYPLLAITKLIQ
ncbi:hypothetical protein N172_06965 [Pantoea dispersa EGD-AAK13]|nr:hypothetical protein N172_06965 [Pantoea dispersa EGD-AAK13]